MRARNRVRAKCESGGRERETERKTEREGPGIAGEESEKQSESEV